MTSKSSYHYKSCLGLADLKLNSRQTELRLSYWFKLSHVQSYTSYCPLHFLALRSFPESLVFPWCVQYTVGSSQPLFPLERVQTWFDLEPTYLHLWQLAMGTNFGSEVHASLYTWQHRHHTFPPPAGFPYSPAGVYFSPPSLKLFVQSPPGSWASLPPLLVWLPTHAPAGD